MNKNIYQIKNLKCKYSSNSQPVLEIEELKIEESSRTFFIGASGIGKSTILETLGLMNNTVHDSSGNNTEFIFNNGFSESIDILDLLTKDEKKIAEFRSKHLSFIFQNTNLFKTLSAFDNIAISAILQGASRTESIDRTTKIVKTLLSDVKEDKPITELSGGQKQRIAFARAVVVNYTILFADEPTGNLDIGNAENLMNTLMQSIGNKTAIIVSHDIPLALKFATKIVLINWSNRQNKTKYGSITPASVYSKINQDSWRHENQIIRSNDLAKLLQNEMLNQAQQ